MARTLVYSCIFHNESYLRLFDLLYKSYIIHGKPGPDVDYLIMCSPDFKSKIDPRFKIWCLDLKTKFEAGCARLRIFDYENIAAYDKVLYLDCDVLVGNDLKNILNIPLENKLYAMPEGNTEFEYWGKQFFEHENPNTEAFSSGVLMFKNHEKIKKLFEEMMAHIEHHQSNGKPIPTCLDQPFICYHAIKNNLYDVDALRGVVVTNPTEQMYQTINHFAGGPGDYGSKHEKMTKYSNTLMDIQEYQNVLSANKEKFAMLYKICKDIGEPVEGNCFTAHLDVDRVIPDLIYKQMNHYILGRGAKNIMEIGFNAGHSSLLYLLANPDSKLTIFDLCEHKYTMPCFEYLDSIFPGRMTMHQGDSTVEVPKYDQSARFDLVHIDGGHCGDIPNKDFFNSLKLASDFIIWDDTQISTLNNMFNGYLQQGYIREFFLHKTRVYEHRIGRKLNVTAM